MPTAVVQLNPDLQREIEAIRSHAPDAPAITINPERQGGTPVIGLSRVPVSVLLDYMATGETLDDFLKDYPTVDREKTIGALDLLKEALEDGLIGTRVNY
ncbi:MAG: DUF433 domain-containing protein [Acidobacteria bacterium]|nr:DUF433 domain-containing protein [Acidobacteriota bacterium]MBI3422919.1 DUF433 domain-containing protein [Acidobacteriota bacterium]